MRVSATVPEVRKYLKMTARTVLASYWRERMGREVTTIEDDVPEAVEPEIIVGDAPAKVRALSSDSPTTTVASWNFVSCRPSRFARRHQMGVSVANAKVLQHRALRMAAQNKWGGDV